jgi:hypothetical protein
MSEQLVKAEQVLAEAQAAVEKASGVGIRERISRTRLEAEALHQKFLGTNVDDAAALLKARNARDGKLAELEVLEKSTLPAAEAALAAAMRVRLEAEAARDKALAADLVAQFQAQETGIEDAVREVEAKIKGLLGAHEATFARLGDLRVEPRTRWAKAAGHARYGGARTSMWKELAVALDGADEVQKEIRHQNWLAEQRKKEGRPTIQEEFLQKVARESAEIAASAANRKKNAGSEDA